ncbi:MAG: M20/M25/M40 family metallo-hydrolase [Clostridia bacterium]|nr:M20/M25/M40 family metallo-hydrolase [Clostridia bacterium]
MYYILAVITAVVLLMIFIIIRTFIFTKSEEIYEVINDSSPVNKDDAVKKLQQAISIKTISNSDTGQTDWQEFKKFIIFLENAFPLIHANMEKTVINDYSLIYKWKGQDEKLKPGMIMAHIDVVPVEEGTLKDWDANPFSGDIKEGFIYGRGSMDIKIQLITAMQACESLLKEGYTPKRDIYLCFGHDEETGGVDGAAHILEYMKNRNLKFEFIIDEGGAVNSGAISSVKKSVAFIGVAEKGYCNLKISIKAKGGHASTPPKNTALGMTSKVICDLEKHKMKKHLTKPSLDMIKALAIHMNFINKMIVANMWLFKPLFMKVFAKPGTTGEALLRTTIAPTMTHASMEPNVLPQVASFTVNCRILQGDSGSKLIHYIKDKCSKYDFNIETLRLDEPSNVSDYKSDIFKLVAGITLGIYEDAVIVPYLMVAGTDCYKFECICKNVIRFTPFFIPMKDMGRIHSTNERNSIENVENCVKFFTTLLKNC